MSDRAIVPCGPCRLCCRLHTPLLPEKGDVIESYDWARWYIQEKNGNKTFKGIILWRKPNEDCIYLTEQGCSIWHRAPYTCRTFDCRETWKKSDRIGRRMAIKSGEMTREIFERGRELVEEERG